MCLMHRKGTTTDVFWVRLVQLMHKIERGIVRADNPMQRGYCYVLACRTGKNFDPAFKPALSPKEMLQLGVFGGHYLNSAVDEYPPSWFTRAKLSGAHDKNVNLFKVDSGLSLEEWRSKGWIHAQDPRGWFEWYCRYYQGRRSPDDRRQIKRWSAYVRHSAQVRNDGRRDITRRVVQRQSLLHWSYDPFPDFSSDAENESIFQKIRRIEKDPAVDEYLTHGPPVRTDPGWGAARRR